MREHTVYSDWSYSTKMESKIIPMLEVDGPEFFKCPNCKTERVGLEHGVEAYCGECGLWFVRYDNLLEIWLVRK